MMLSERQERVVPPPPSPGSVSRVLGALTVAAALGCASGYYSGPPGGPVDHTPPKVIAAVPESGAVGVRRRELTIRFDKVISERPTSQQATSLADMVLVSPRDGAPSVDWHRDHITISLRHGWRPNTAYTITLLPGIADLRNNALRTPTVITFTAGATIPATTMHGVIFDAVRGGPESGARVEAVARPDTSLVYVTVADSTGRFTLQGVNSGTYLLRAYVDDNHNRALDSREAYDSMTVVLRDSVRSELLAFVHDSLGPQLATVSPVDSVTLNVSFETPLDPTQRLSASQFVLLAPDSARIPVTAATQVREDTLGRRDTTRRPLAPQDSAQRDTTPAPGALPRPTRPLLIRTVLLTLSVPLKPRTEYRLRATAIRGPTGGVLTSERTFTTSPARAATNDSAGARRVGPTAPTLPHPLRQQRP